MLEYELVQAAVPEHAGSLRVDVDARRQSRRFAHEEYTERDLLSRCGRQHDMSVARMEPDGDAATSLVYDDVLAPDRPVAGKPPVVDLQLLW